LFIPDPDLDFSPIPDPGSRGQKGTGSRIRIRNTVKMHKYKKMRKLTNTKISVVLREPNPDWEYGSGSRRAK
jgi:hypothetical protein